MPRREEAPYVKLHGFVRRAEAIYARVKETLEKEHWGEVVVIEPDSGDYFVDEDRHKAIRNAEEKYPDMLFHMRRIGDNPAVIRYPSRAQWVGLTR